MRNTFFRKKKAEMGTRLFASAIILAISLFTACFSVLAAPQEKINVFVSILPQKYIVERIGGPRVDVTVLVGQGKSPATYEPTLRQMARMGRSRVYFRIGTPFENALMEKIYRNFEDLKIVDLRAGIPIRSFTNERLKGGGVADPHIWLNPRYVKIQAVTVCRALCEIYPLYSTEFVANMQGLLRDLDELDGRISALLKPVQGKNIYVFHPAYGYFCDAYGLTQIAIESEGKEPSSKELTYLIRRVREERARTIFVQPQYTKRNAEAVARAAGSAVVPINPLPSDYIKDMEEMAHIIKESL